MQWISHIVYLIYLYFVSALNLHEIRQPVGLDSTLLHKIYFLPCFECYVFGLFKCTYLREELGKHSNIPCCMHAMCILWNILFYSIGYIIGDETDGMNPNHIVYQTPEWWKNSRNIDERRVFLDFFTIILLNWLVFVIGVLLCRVWLYEDDQENSTKIAPQWRKKWCLRLVVCYMSLWEP